LQEPAKNLDKKFDEGRGVLEQLRSFQSKGEFTLPLKQKRQASLSLPFFKSYLDKVVLFF